MRGTVRGLPASGLVVRAVAGGAAVGLASGHDPLDAVAAGCGGSCRGRARAVLRVAGLRSPVVCAAGRSGGLSGALGHADGWRAARLSRAAGVHARRHRVRGAGRRQGRLGLHDVRRDDRVVPAAALVEVSRRGPGAHGGLRSRRRPARRRRRRAGRSAFTAQRRGPARRCGHARHRRGRLCAPAARARCHHPLPGQGSVDRAADRHGARG